MEQLKYNDYSDKSRPKTLKPGQCVKFRVIGSESRLQSLLQLSNEDYIWDEGKEEMIPIAAIKKLKAEGKPELYNLDLNEVQQKCWVLFGGNRADMEIYRFLQKCNFNKSNKERESSHDPIIEEFDRSSAIAIEKQKMDTERAAVNTAADMTEAEVRKYFSDDISAIDTLRIRIEKEAAKSPHKFTSKKESKKDVDIKSLIQEAEKKGFISYDQETKEWLDEDKVSILKCGTVVGVNGKYIDFVRWVESGEGKDMVDVITEKLS